MIHSSSESALSQRRRPEEANPADSRIRKCTRSHPTAKKVKSTQNIMLGRLCCSSIIPTTMFLLAAIVARTASSALPQVAAAETIEAPTSLFGEGAFMFDIKTTTGQSVHSISSNSSSSSRHRNSRGLRGVGRIEVDKNGEPCLRNPLEDRLVDPSEYQYGCREINRMMTRRKQLIGSGMVRDVYLVTYKGQELVVKTLKDAEGRTRQKIHLSMHRREVLTMDALRGHPNIVSMLGLCDTTVVTKFFTDGFQKKTRRRGKPMPIQEVVSLALDAAKGLQALHEIGGIHFDMKPMQVLIDEESGRAMINDFNIVLLMGTAQGPGGEFCATHGGVPDDFILWRSPENYAGKPLTAKVDIYSMGMIYYSLIAGKKPYDTPESLEEARLHGTRPEIDPSWHKGYVDLVQQMWLEDPEKRPCARQVVERLTAIQEEEGMFA